MSIKIALAGNPNCPAERRGGQNMRKIHGEEEKNRRTCKLPGFKKLRRKLSLLHYCGANRRSKPFDLPTMSAMDFGTRGS